MLCSNVLKFRIIFWIVIYCCAKWKIKDKSNSKITLKKFFGFFSVKLVFSTQLAVMALRLEGIWTFNNDPFCLNVKSCMVMLHDIVRVWSVWVPRRNLQSPNMKVGCKLLVFLVYSHNDIKPLTADHTGSWKLQRNGASIPQAL